MDENKEKFAKVPVDSEGKSWFQGYIKVGDYIAQHEIWLWDGISGQSLIFDENDVSEVSDCELQELVASATRHKDNSSITRNRSGFAFVNFDFDMGD